MINSAHFKIGLVELYEMQDMHYRVLFSLFSCNFFITHANYDMFDDVLEEFMLVQMR